MSSNLLLVVAAPVLLVSCSLPPLAEGVDPAPDPFEVETPTYVLGPNDLLRVTVFGHPELSSLELGDRVDFLGRLDLPLVDPVVVKGLTPDAASEAIEQSLQEVLVDPDVSLSVMEYSSRVFYVLGEVLTPGAIPLDRPLTALQALSLAGPTSDSADIFNVAVLRGQPDELEVHIFDAATPGRDGMFPILPNDLIFVRRSRAGSFKEQILPIVQSIAPPLTSLASLIIAAERIGN